MNHRVEIDALVLSVNTNSQWMKFLQDILQPVLSCCVIFVLCGLDMSKNSAVRVMVQRPRVYSVVVTVTVTVSLLTVTHTYKHSHEAIFFTLSNQSTGVCVHEDSELINCLQA